METGDLMRVLYLSLLIAAIGGSFLLSQRNNIGKTLQQAAIWALIFVGVVGAYGLWEDISRDVSQQQSVMIDGAIEVPRSMDGHYYLTLEVNGTPVEFVVDTGASQVVLTQEDAARVGLSPENLRYLGIASTANGEVRTASVRLDTVALEGIVDENVPAVVNEGQMFGSLLGMTYLDQFSRIEIRNGRLVLTR
ncbi:retropepsin-like aspartic protease family protein [Yoonia sediminilitoris]|uniref:Aspartyl protease family protein n=1 Tax=Yoonia sediminilitoris TaxID=1286148 RepID=A0A2T6KCS6_9RHOB|nr:TIGR02281 family clan AA aspartic protease [Yoonia sediminilitoris]PUB12762.1 aspartyl protease family protein [Yoonia sediminilitoris]RCW94241.1 aspartyl protease family protein [Yoonia sediminilitoris]